MSAFSFLHLHYCKVNVLSNLVISKEVDDVSAITPCYKLETQLQVPILVVKIPHLDVVPASRLLVELDQVVVTES